MPQGGSGGKGNGGAGVTSNGGSKQKLRGKPKASSYKAQQQPAVAPCGSTRRDVAVSTS
eukprot:COSAG06_NODE_27826_length_585_cov_3.067901_1_plen_59_part_00